MKILKRFFLVTIITMVAAFLIPSTASADCPNKTIKGKYGQHGWEGTCWHKGNILKGDMPRCKKCGKKHLRGIQKWDHMPHVVRNKCMGKVKKRMDGCSVPLKDPMSKDFKHVLKGACDAHDLCYHSGHNKHLCDVKFHQNMVHECKHYYNGHRNNTMRGFCEAAALTWATTVMIHETGQKAYDKDQKWAKENECL